MKVEAAQPSLFGKLVAWFKSLSEEEQPKAKPAASRPRHAQRPERGERGERPEGGGKRRDRGGRGERSEGGNNRDRNEPRSKPAPAEAKPQEPRQPKPPRQPKVAEEKPVLESQVVAAAVEQAEAGTPPKEGARRRGRRGGRRDRENRESVAQNAAALAASEVPVIVQQPSSQPDAVPAPVMPTEYVAYPDGYVKPSEYIAMPTNLISSQKSVASALPAVIVSTLPAVVAPSLPAVVPSTVAKTSGNSHGLIQIETDPIKVSTETQVPAMPVARHTPRRRERQREVFVENEPLVQVETQHPQG
jgi:ribonuclease E